MSRASFSGGAPSLIVIMMRKLATRSYYSGSFPEPAYGMGARGELLVTVSGGAPEKDVVWATVAERGHWFYVPPSSGQSGGTIMINSAAVAGGTTGSIATQSSGTGVFLPEPRIRTVPRVQQPTSWAPLVPERDVRAPTAGGNNNPELNTDAGKGKEIQMSYAAAVKGGPSHAAMEEGPNHAPMRAGPNQQGHRFSWQKNEAVTAAMEAPPLKEEVEKATTPTVDDFPKLVLLPEEWIY